MAEEQSTIKCPNCGTDINVNDVIYHQLEEQLKEKFAADMVKEKATLSAEASRLAKEKQSLEEQGNKLNERVSNGIKDGIRAARAKLAHELRKQIADETSEQLKSMGEELNRKTDQLKEFNKAKSEIERLKREKEEIKSSVQAEFEKKLSEILKREKAQLQKAEEEKVRFRLLEKEQHIEQLRKQLQDAQKKAEEASTRLQGEVQELAIEEWLEKQFPLDTIEEVKKGASGADCLQIINTRTRLNCGSIYYESKRTRNFQPAWIEKFKHDIREKGANIGVLITEVMPTDMERMGPKDGIWICTFDEFKGLCVVLRESLVQINHAIATQENKGDKMALLYDYLTGDEFRFQVEGILEGFVQMQNDLESEKRSLQSIWKKREKQIQKVILNTNQMHSSIKGIAGSAIQPVKQLELPQDEIEG